MRKTFGIITASILLLFAFVANVHGQESRASKVITVPKGTEITKDFYVTGGDVVEISGTVNGDVLVGAGQLTIDGTVNGDVLAAGGVLNISGDVRDDVRIAGGQISLTGNIGRNLTVGGGDVNIGENAVIVGGIVVGAGNLRLAGEVGGDVLVGSGNTTLSGIIGGDVEIYTGALVVSSGADIAGDLVYTSEEEATIDKQASVSGQLLQKTPPVVVADADKKVSQALEGLVALKFQAKLVSFLSALLVGMILIKLFPKYGDLVKETLQNNPWKALLWGSLFLFLTPLAFIALLITVLGIPLALFGLMALGTYIYLSKIFVGYWLGDKIPLGDKSNSYLSFALGLAAYYILTLVPVLGGFVSFAALLFGMGAGLLACKEYYQKVIAS